MKTIKLSDKDIERVQESLKDTSVRYSQMLVNLGERNKDTTAYKNLEIINESFIKIHISIKEQTNIS